MKLINQTYGRNSVQWISKTKILSSSSQTDNSLVFELLTECRHLFK